MTTPAITATTLGPRLRASRVLIGMDQEQMAHALGVGRSTVSGWERDLFEPVASALFAWAQITKQPLDWFAEGLDGKRARRDSNPQPSDLESTRARRRAARRAATRQSVRGGIRCQDHLDAGSRVLSAVA